MSRNLNYAEVYKVLGQPKPTEPGLKGCLTPLLALVGGILLRGWMFMLLLGVIHSNLTWIVPAWGYWTSTVTILLFRASFYIARREKS